MATNPPPVVVAAQPAFDEVALAALTNRFAVDQQRQAERLEQLQARLEQFEKREAERLAATAAERSARGEASTAQQARIDGLLKQISELETKVAALQTPRVLPEIAVGSEDAPTVAELDQKVRILERNHELAGEAAAVKAKEAPRLQIGANGFTLASADTNYVLKLRGLVQLDSRAFFDDSRLNRGNDSFVLRRARPILEGTLARDFDFSFIPDFGGSGTPSIFDACLNYRFRQEWQLRAGKFKTPVGFEQLQSDGTLAFNERSLVSGLLPNRNVGVQLWGEPWEGGLTYALGVFNGAGDARNASNVDFDDGKEVAARLFWKPFKSSGWKAGEGFGFGLGGTWSQVSSNAAGLPNTTGGSLPGYATDGQQQFFAYNPTAGTVVADGSQWRLSPQATYTWGPFGLLGEYAISHQSVLNSVSQKRGALDHTGWQVSAQWVLTGEDASFTGISPRRPFNLANGSWGAWQVVGRFGELEVDPDTFPNFANPGLSARGATTWGVGLNWWLNRQLRVLSSFSHTSFEGGGRLNPLDPATLIAPSAVSARDENVFFTRLQLSF